MTIVTRDRVQTQESKLLSSNSALRFKHVTSSIRSSDVEMCFFQTLFKSALVFARQSTEANEGREQV